MSLTPGTRIGPYEITARIGAGGMGEVYRATDTNLKREVAIKVLPDAVASDAERLARFDREARTLAALNHPNIAGIHGLEKSARAIALVMELVDGPTLADRIAQGAIPVDEVLAIARQIAEALEAAHEQGIVHRDLKPANVKLRPDGTVKVLDFGLAKAIEPASAASSSLSMSPTITTPAMTQAGMILGTAAYMSPEQAKGRSADRRSDVWAFGVVLFEMLSGERAFDGPDVSDTMAAVLMRDPDWTRLPSATPPAVVAALRLCLQRDRRQRARDIGDVRLALEGAFGVSPSTVVDGPRPEVAAWRRAVPLAAAALAGAIVAGLVVWLVTPARAAPPLTTFEHRIPVELPFTVQGLTATALSPDGRYVVYAALGGLYLRAMDTLEGRLIPGVGARVGGPTFSPDSRSVAYFDTAAVQLMRIATSGGAAVPIAPAVVPMGVSWAADGRIYFGQPGGIHRVAATGGTPELVVPAENGEFLSGPQLLPDGDTVLFTTAPSTSGTAWAQGSIVAQSLRTGERTVLVQGGNDGRYVAGGYLVYALEDVLYGAAFDVEHLNVRPDRVPLVQGVRRPPGGAPGGGTADFGLSADGTLMYVTGGGVGDRRILVWVDRQGREDPLNVPVRAYLYPRISPDGTRIALDLRDQQDDIWIWNMDRENLTQLTFNAGQDMYPVWSPDGTHIAFASQEGGGIPNIYWRRADGTGAASLLLEDLGELSPTAFSRDGASLIFTNRLDNVIAGVSTDGEQQVSTLVAAENVVLHNADVSPDGRWVAYQSNESGMDEIYVRPFPDTESGKWTVSSGGGTRPLWARDGRELFYYLDPGRVMAVPVEAGDTFTYGNPQVVVDGLYNSGLGRTYDVSPDGQRFLMVKLAPSTDEALAGVGLVFVQHWTEELKRLVPTR